MTPAKPKLGFPGAPGVVSVGHAGLHGGHGYKSAAIDGYPVKFGLRGAKMPSKSKAQQRFFGAIKGGAIPRPAGMSDKVVDEFARTRRTGLPEHLADGRKAMTNTGFQQGETKRGGSRPAWMEKVPVTKLPENLADGKWAAKAFGSNKGGLHRATGTPGKPIPVYRVKKAAHSKDSHVQHMAQAAININPGRYGK